MRLELPSDARTFGAMEPGPLGAVENRLSPDSYAASALLNTYFLSVIVRHSFDPRLVSLSLRGWQTPRADLLTCKTLKQKPRTQAFTG